MHIITQILKIIFYATKEKIVDKLDVIKTENLHASKNTTKRMKKQSTEWEKVFADHVSDKR